MEKLRLLFHLLRLDQWVKNILLFTPLLFALQFSVVGQITRLLEWLHLSPLYKWVYETALKDSHRVPWKQDILKQTKVFF